MSKQFSFNKILVEYYIIINIIHEEQAIFRFYFRAFYFYAWEIHVFVDKSR